MVPPRIHRLDAVPSVTAGTDAVEFTPAIQHQSRPRSVVFQPIRAPLDRFCFADHYLLLPLDGWVTRPFATGEGVGSEQEQGRRVHPGGEGHDAVRGAHEGGSRGVLQPRLDEGGDCLGRRDLVRVVLHLKADMLFFLLHANMIYCHMS